MISFLHFLFPPYCLACKEKCSTRVFCQDCWLLCELPDPVSRCRHCFEEIDEKQKLCKACRFQRKLSVQRAYVFDPESPARLLGQEELHAMAGFAIVQWIALDWEFPSVIVPMPDSVSIALAFASDLGVPLAQALTKGYEYKEGRLEEGETILLFDVSSPIPALQKAGVALSESFPKKVYLLSLFPSDTGSDPERRI